MSNTENNKMIARFMGVKQSYGTAYINKKLTFYLYAQFRYNEKWEVLMPVLEKIARTKIGDGETTVDYAYPYTFGKLNIETGKIMVRLHGFFVHEADTLHEATYMAVVEVLKYIEENESGSKS